MSDWLDAESHADRAFEMYERGRWAEAESELRKALSLNPGQAEWHFNLGLTLEASGRDRDAMASYERAADLLPDQAEPLVAAGVVANRLQQYTRAIHCFDRALQLDGRCEGAYASKIESLVGRGDHDEAETVFYMSQQALDEPSASCLSVIAESLFQRGHFSRAAWCLKEAMRLDPAMPRLMARLGAVYAALNKPQRAMQLYLRDLREDPGNIDTLLDYGELLVSLGRLPEAAEKFRRVLELEPANVDAHMRLGEIASESRRFEQAHLEFELVLKLDPHYPRVRLMLGEALLRRGKIGDARRVLLEELDRLHAQQEQQSLTDEQTATGTPGAAPGSPDGGRPGVEGPDSDDPGQCPRWRVDELQRLGKALMDARLPARAAEVFESALKQDPLPQKQRATLLRRLALAFFQAGDRSRGVAASRRVLRIEPRCIASMHNLALAALEQGRLRTAGGWIRRGLLINRHDDGLRRLRMRVALAWIRAAFRRLPGR